MKYIALVVLLACNEPSKPKQQAVTAPAPAGAPPAPAAAPPAPAAAPAPAARTEACTAALQSFDKFVDTGDPATPPEERAKVKASVLERCVADTWSEPALACMRAAGTSHDTFKCWNEQLTKAQRDAVSSAFAKLSQP